MVALTQWSDIAQRDKQAADMTARVARCVSGFSPVLTSEKLKVCTPQTIFCTCLQGKLGVAGLPGYPGRQGLKVIKNCLTFIWIFESLKSAR